MILKNNKVLENNKLLASLGMFSLVLGILLRSFGPDVSVVHFLAGLFLGLSLALNLTVLVLYRISKRKE